MQKYIYNLPEEMREEAREQYRNCREPFGSKLQWAMSCARDEATQLAQMGVGLDLLISNSPGNLICRLVKYPELLKELKVAKDRNLFKERISEHEERHISHPLYASLLWRYKHPDRTLQYLQQGVPVTFLKEHYDLPMMSEYIKECNIRNLPVDKGEHYEIMRRVEDSSSTGVDNDYWKVVLTLVDKGSTLLDEQMVPGSTRELYVRYLNDAYNVDIGERIPTKLLFLAEAWLYRGMDHTIPIDRLSDPDMLHVIGVITTELNIKAYVGISADRLTDVLLDLEPGEIPKELLGNYLRY